MEHFILSSSIRDLGMWDLGTPQAFGSENGMWLKTGCGFEAIMLRILSSPNFVVAQPNFAAFVAVSLYKLSASVSRKCQCGLRKHGFELAVRFSVGFNRRTRLGGLVWRIRRRQLRRVSGLDYSGSPSQRRRLCTIFSGSSGRRIRSR